MTSRPPLSPWALAIAGGVAFAYLADLAFMALTHRWLVDGSGHPLATDFLSFWSAGRLALTGHASEAYDWARMHAFQQELMSHPMAGFLGWAYPPLFFLVAMPLALMPYGASFLAWFGVSTTLYLAVVSRIVKERGAVLVAFAAPASLACAIAGQNGFLTAALMGAILLELEARPVLAGLLLALLTYKPHFGLLFPVALLFGGDRRAFGAALLGTLAIMLLSWVIAPDSLAAFIRHIGGMSRDFLEHGDAGFYKLQSLYGLLRNGGVSDGMAFAAQGLLFASVTVFVAWLWRSAKPLALKCAGLLAATLLATPYLFLYDFPILSVAIAFLWRDRPFDRAETALLILSQLAIAGFLLVKEPMGLLAAALTLAVIARRVTAPGGTALPTRPAEQLEPAARAG